MEGKNFQQRQELYVKLCDKQYESYPYNKYDLEENMELVEVVIGEYWKPRYLIDNNTKTAVEFMNSREYLTTVTSKDILMGTLSGISKELKERARNLYAHFPTFISNFSEGVAKVSWQINPDGRYYGDEDGYGMTNDREETLYGFIDHEGRVVSKFRKIFGSEELIMMKKEAIYNCMYY